MPKTTRTYWNPLSAEHQPDWQRIEGLEGIAKELTLAIDEETGDYTRLTRFAPGADTKVQRTFPRSKSDSPRCWASASTRTGYAVSSRATTSVSRHSRST